MKKFLLVLSIVLCEVGYLNVYAGDISHPDSNGNK